MGGSIFQRSWQELWKAQTPKGQTIEIFSSTHCPSSSHSCPPCILGFGRKDHRASTYCPEFRQSLYPIDIAAQTIMPFFVGRIVAHRLASSVAATSSSRLVVAKQLGRVSGSPLLRAGFVRAYATPGRPKKSDTDSSTQSAGRSRKTADGAAPKKVTAAKKTTATKATTKATAKKATGTSKSPKAKKTSPPPKKKKVLTDKQKAAKELSKARKEKAELKQKALFTEPKNLPRTAWTVYMTREAAGGGFEGDMVAKMPTIANAFKALSSSELEVI